MRCHPRRAARPSARLSLTLSTPGTLSATISSARSTASTARTHPFVQPLPPCGGVHEVRPPRERADDEQGDVRVESGRGRQAGAGEHLEHAVSMPLRGQESGVPLGGWEWLPGAEHLAGGLLGLADLHVPQRRERGAVVTRVARVRVRLRLAASRWSRDLSGRPTSPARPARAARRAASVPPVPWPRGGRRARARRARSRPASSRPHPRTRRTAPACTRPPPRGRPPPSARPSRRGASSPGAGGAASPAVVGGRPVGGRERVRDPGRPDGEGHRDDPDGSPAAGGAGGAGVRLHRSSGGLRVSTSPDRAPEDPGCRVRCPATSDAAGRALVRH